MQRWLLCCQECAVHHGMGWIWPANWMPRCFSPAELWWNNSELNSLLSAIILCVSNAKLTWNLHWAKWFIFLCQCFNINSGSKVLCDSLFGQHSLKYISDIFPIYYPINNLLISNNVTTIESWECPPGYLKCPNDYCIPPQVVCDGTKHCLNGEDELACGRSSLPA